MICLRLMTERWKDGSGCFRSVNGAEVLFIRRVPSGFMAAGTVTIVYQI